MSKHFVQSAALRSLLLASYRAYARSQFWRSGPRIFVNSIPKAGTHLLISELERFPSLQNSRLHLELTKIKMPGPRPAGGYPDLDLTKIRRAIEGVRPGQFFSAHLFWFPALMDLLEESGVRSIFMARDPRDILVSRLHYIVGLRRHWLHDHMTRNYVGETARYRLLLDGYPGPPFVLPMKQLLEGHVPWMRAESVLVVKFEDLVGERGGGSNEAKLRTLEKIADHCGLPAQQLNSFATAAARTTVTLRRGKVNTWRDELPREIAEEVTRDWAPILSALGYLTD